MLLGLTVRFPLPPHDKTDALPDTAVLATGGLSWGKDSHFARNRTRFLGSNKRKARLRSRIGLFAESIATDSIIRFSDS